MNSGSTICQEQKESVFYWNNLPGELQEMVVAEMPATDLIVFKEVSRQTYQLAKIEIGKRLTSPIYLSFYDSIPCNVTGLSEVRIHLSNQRGFSKSYSFFYLLQRGTLPQGFSSGFIEQFSYDVFPLEITAECIFSLREGYNGEHTPWKEKNKDKFLGTITLEKLENTEGDNLKTIYFTREQTQYGYSQK